MNVKYFRWPLWIVVASLVYWGETRTGGTLGISQSYATGGHYRFEGGTDPDAIIAAVILITIYVLFLFAPLAKIGAPMTGLSRRFVAFWLDFIISIGALVPLVGIAPVLLEWRRTGIFTWTFTRDFSAPYDSWLSMSLAIVGLPAIILYFALPLVRRLPTPGSCMMGYQIVPDDEDVMTLWKASKRVCFGFIAACGAYFVSFRPSDKKRGKFWLDLKFGTHAVILE